MTVSQKVLKLLWSHLASLFTELQNEIVVTAVKGTDIEIEQQSSVELKTPPLFYNQGCISLVILADAKRSFFLHTFLALR